MDSMEGLTIERPDIITNPPRNQNHRYDQYKLNMDLPTLNGFLHIKDFLEWIS